MTESPGPGTDRGRAAEGPRGARAIRIACGSSRPSSAEAVTTSAALAREIGMGRPLLHMHLQRLEAAGLVAGTLELSEDGKAMKYFEVTPFCYQLTPETVAEAARTIDARETAREKPSEGATGDDRQRTGGGGRRRRRGRSSVF